MAAITGSSLMTVSPPPSSSAYSVSQLSRTDYVIIMLAFTVALVVIYHIVFLKCCPQRESINGGLLEEGVVRNNNNGGVLNLHAIPCKVYKKEGEVQDINNECAVCLCAFVDGEDQIRQLPLCNHYFHISCIDMWLHSHMNCPICRAKVVISRANSSKGLGEEGNMNRDILPV